MRNALVILLFLQCTSSLANEIPVRPSLVMDMWKDLKKSRNPDTLYLVALRCEILTSRYERKWGDDPSDLEEWGIDGDQIHEWYNELAYLRWPKSTWESPLEPPEAWIEEMAQSANNHFRYGLYLTRLEENKGPNYVGRFMAYMETNEKELNLCAQIAKNY